MAIRAHTLKRVADTVLGALLQAVPDRVPAAPAGSISCVSFAGIRSGSRERFGLSDLVAGGGGGRPALDGIEAVDTDVSNCMNVPAEAIEAAYPLRVLHYRLRRDGGGGGKHRGGTGVERAIVVTVGEITASYRSERHFTSPWGVFGGRAGTRWRSWVRRADGTCEEIRSKARITLHAGDELRVDTGGGGGYGLPWQRDPLLVADDVRDGKVSRAAAWHDYGVAVTEEGTLDAAETTRRRREMAACNAVPEIYDRGEPD